MGNLDNSSLEVAGDGAAVQRNFDRLGVQVPSLSRRATTLEGRATTLEGRATTLEGRATTLESRATALEGRATTLEGRATTLETRATALETRATANESVWRPIMEGFGSAGAITSNTFGFFENGTLNLLGGAANPALRIKRLLDADVAITGKITKLRISAGAAVNTTAPAITFTFELRAITAVGGGAGNVTYTVGSAVATAVLTTPAASGVRPVTGTAIDFPADGDYCMTVTTSGGTAPANHQSHLFAHLEMRHV